MYVNKSLTSVFPPNTVNPTLPTAADALAQLRAHPALTEAQRRDRISAVTTFVRIARPGAAGGALPRDGLEREAALVPMDPALATRVFHDRPHRMLGIASPRRRDAIVSLLRGVMRELGTHAPALPTAAGLAPAWAALHARLTPERQKALIGFMGWCTVEGLAPEAVAPDTLDVFEAWSVARTIHRDPHGRARRVASNWAWARGAIPGWPQAALSRVGMRDQYALPWKAYSSKLREEVDAFLGRLTGAGGDADLADLAFGEDEDLGAGSPPRRLGRPLRPRTVQTRRDALKVSLAALVAAGHDPQMLCLADLVQPIGNAQTVLAFHRRRALERRAATLSPTEAAALRPADVRTSGLATLVETLRQVGRFHVGLPQAELRRIGELRRKVAPRVQMSMSEANRRRLGTLVEPAVQARLLDLPRRLMARSAEPGVRPRAAALMALQAVALELLLIFPVRRANLVGLRLDRHLRRAEGDGPIREIFVPGEEVKNGEALQCPVPPASAALVQRYLDWHRPVLAEAGNPFLFPGAGQAVRGAHDLSVDLKATVQCELGVAFNLHLMRHLAVYRFLNVHTGQYEVARRLLGHRKVETTRAFYAGLEGDAAFRQLSDVLEGARKGYGRWLAVLAAAGELDPIEAPAARVTRERAKLYLRALQGAGNAANTIHTRFWHLQSALRVLQPEEDFAWLTSWMQRLLPVRLRERTVPDARDLVAWGEDLMDRALAHPCPLVRRTLYCDGLLIGVLAHTGLRLRSVASLRLGVQVLGPPQGAAGWRLHPRPEDVKNHRPVPLDLTEVLGTRLDRYHQVERAELLEGQAHDWLWVGRGGAPLGSRGIEGMVRRASTVRFGVTFGPHTFRHALATTAAQADPDNPGLAAAVLGVSEATVEAHYNRARQEDAMARLHQCLAQDREHLMW